MSRMMDTMLPDSLHQLPFSFILSVLFLIIAAIYISSRLLSPSTSQKNLPLPPGPKGYPLLGNLLDLLPTIPKGTQHLLFQKWAREYCEIYRVQLGPVTQFMLNSDVAVKAIPDKNAAASSDRPRWIVSNEHMCGS
jgi:cytochrome P450 family 619